ncbi:MAG: VIT domain-containing protein [Thermoplasmatota archaeon]
MTPNNSSQYRSSLIFLLAFTIVVSGLLMGLGGSSEGQARSTDPIEIMSIKVDSSLKNSFEKTTIKQALFNNGTASANETFQFKIPEGAFITGFAVTKNGITYNAKLYTKEDAQNKFNSSVQKGTSAGILLSRGTTRFSYGISFAPGDKITASLTYERYNQRYLGDYCFDLYLSDINQGRLVPEIELKISIQALDNITKLNATGKYTMVKTTWNSASSCEVLLKDHNIRYVSNLHIRYRVREQPLTGKFLTYDSGKEAYFFHVFTPTTGTIASRSLNKDIVFVLDKSGSMGGMKITQLKEAFEDIIWKLGKDDRFNIIMFDSDIYSFWNDLKAANESNKGSAAGYVSRISAGGSTNLNDGLELALSQLKNLSVSSIRGAPIIVLLTDGLANRGKYTTPDTIRKNILGLNSINASIYTLGFGFDLDFEFLKALALENHGMGVRIYDDIDSADQLIDFYKMISTPLLANLSFDYSPGVTDVYPKRADFIFNGSEMVITGKISREVKNVNSSIRGTTGSGVRYINGTFKVSPDSKNSYIEKSWAFARVKYLLDMMTIQGGTNLTIKEIVDLSLKYGFMTPFTAFFIDVGSFETEFSGSDSNDYDSGGSSYSLGGGGGSTGYGGSSNSADGDGEGGTGGPSPPPPEYISMEEDTDGDGIADAFDSFPDDSTRWYDPNSVKSNEADEAEGEEVKVDPPGPDGWTDTDCDGICDKWDAFPYDPEEWKDSDGDGHGDNSDELPYDPDRWLLSQERDVSYYPYDSSPGGAPSNDEGPDDDEDTAFISGDDAEDEAHNGNDEGSPGGMEPADGKDKDDGFKMGPLPIIIIVVMSFNIIMGTLLLLMRKDLIG